MSIPATVFVNRLQEAGFDFFTGVPDSTLGSVIQTLMQRRVYTPAVREDEAMAMAAGAYMGGKAPVVLMQNSGLGTSLNTVISLNLMYLQPCLLLIGWRGHDGKDAPEHLVMGQIMKPQLDLIRIPHRTLTEQTYEDDLNWAVQEYMKQHIPVALLVVKGVLA